MKGNLLSMGESLINKPFLENNLARFRKCLWGRCSWLVWSTESLFSIPCCCLYPCCLHDFVVLPLEGESIFLHIDVVVCLVAVFGQWKVNKCVLQAEV